MASAISFKSSNLGSQMGVNNGSVTNHFYMPSNEESQTNTRPCDQSQAHYVVPFLENRHFTGRESTLDELKQKLFSQAHTDKLALFGLGGIGKTQIALQLAQWVKANIPDCSIFWAPAFSLESFEQACWQIAKELQIHQNLDGESAMELVHRHLSSEKAGKWLFIVDNADDLDLLFDELNQYLPASKKGVTFLTTRSREVAVSFAEKDIVELHKMTTKEGITFLAKSLGEDLLSDEKLTIQLLEQLNLLPLAIAQAAHYICRNNGTIARYLELMHITEEDRMRLASRDFRDSTRYRKMPNAVTATWLISFNHIKSFDPSAADLLEYISYLEPKAIPRSILPILNTEEEMDFAIGTLCSYGFLTRRHNKDMFDIHSLVQLSTRVWITETHRTQQVITTVTQHMDKCFPSDEYKDRDKWRMCLPHALEILRREESLNLTERYSLLSKVGNCFLEDGRAKEAVDIFEDVCVWTGSHFDEEHLSRLTSQRKLARAYQSEGQDRQAVELLERVVKVQDRTLEEEHPDRLDSQNELAAAYLFDGQIRQAVALLERLVTLQERTLEEEHPSRLVSQHTLVELLERVVTVQERTLEEEHPSRLASQRELAAAYLFDGQIKQAVALLERVVTLQERMLEEEHPSRLVSQHTLGRAYLLDGQIKQAVELLERVVIVQERMRDEEHPYRLTSQHSLAGVYQANGQIEQAIQLLEHVVAVRERTLDEDNFERLASQHDLAVAYHSHGQTKQAVELLEHVVPVQEKTRDEEHPSRPTSQHSLAEVYQANGQIEQAIQLLEHVVAVRERTLDEDNPDRLASQKALQHVKQLR
ncbi:hypothetical protein N7520_004759 [Penicillium odoratum]|uniref:uncharacterized protein n=1 Tax=Penicillium odoratum TaxID=1167516 RepID=UPI0025497FD8|nr:uncharacterized protein N7520_004759 [Penicillium odoratum]KAJ5765200.1 hypothetical protein N7520_004759 [Penicillium odoratum]